MFTNRFVLAGNNLLLNLEKLEKKSTIHFYSACCLEASEQLKIFMTVTTWMVEQAVDKASIQCAPGLSGQFRVLAQIPV